MRLKRDGTSLADGEKNSDSLIQRAAKEDEESAADETSRTSTSGHEGERIETPATEKAGAPEGKPDGRPQVHVPTNLQDLIAGIPIIPEDVERLVRRRRLNRLVHGMLTVGLVLSTAIMLTGIAFDLVLHRQIPSAAPRFEEIVSQLKSLQPSGILALGLLILIATPIFRVIGSFFAFLHERDWPYVGVTFLVLVILFISLMFGRG